MTPIRLITIPISHYGERARWALDWAGIDYEEVHHLQMFSWISAFGHGRRKTLPVLLTGDGVLTDSGEIVAWASERAAASLWPSSNSARSEVDRLASEFAVSLGVESRRVVYEWFLRSGGTILPYNAGRAPKWQEAAFRWAFRSAGAFAARYLDIRPDSVARGIDIIDRTFEAIAERIRDGRPFLVGEHFSAADLTFATMAAPCLLPARYGNVLPSPEMIPPDARARVLRWRAHPAGAFALRLYEERPRPRGRYRRTMRMPPRVADFPA